MDSYSTHELAPLTATYYTPSRTSLNTAYSSTAYSHLGSSPALGTEDHTAQEAQDYQEETYEPPEQQSLAWVLFTQVFAFCWILPITALLILNIKRHIIGSSAWCPFSQCYPAIYAGDRAAIMKTAFEHDRQTHNLLGTLQLVAKALEIWFILITTWLVYLITIIIAQTQAGMPIGYLTRPSEFAEVPSLFDGTFWTTLRGIRINGLGHSTVKKRLWIFVVVSILLCALCNLSEY